MGNTRMYGFALVHPLVSSLHLVVFPPLFCTLDEPAQSYLLLVGLHKILVS